MNHCAHNPDRYMAQPDTNRKGWIRVTCGDCGKFLGYQDMSVTSPKQKKTK